MVTIDRSACIGCGLCINNYPDMFELDGEYIAKVKKVNTVNNELLEEVVLGCPVMAIERR